MSNLLQLQLLIVRLFQAQSDDDDVADDVSVNVGGPDDFMTEFFAEVSIFVSVLETSSSGNEKDNCTLLL